MSGNNIKLRYCQKRHLSLTKLYWILSQLAIAYIYAVAKMA